MSSWKNDIIKIISSNQELSFHSWIILLNFYEKHKKELDIEDLKLIVDRSEEIRIYLNENSCSYIEKHEVYPNIYEHYENMIEKNTEKKKTIKRYEYHPTLETNQTFC